MSPPSGQVRERAERQDQQDLRAASRSGVCSHTHTHCCLPQSPVSWGSLPRFLTGRHEDILTTSFRSSGNSREWTPLRASAG